MQCYYKQLKIKAVVFVHASPSSMFHIAVTIYIIYIYICMYICMYVYMYVYIYVCI